MSWHIRAGLLMFRFVSGELQVFLAHPGGPTRDPSDEHSWTLPKGGQKPYETLLQAAQREFEEEVGIPPREPFFDLGTIQQKNGKVVRIWAFRGDWDESQPIRSPMRQIIWPLDSGELQSFPEFDRAAFFSVAEAHRRLNRRYQPFLERLNVLVNSNRLPRDP